MEEFHASAGAETGPEDRAAPAPLDAGRLGGMLCQLQRARFDGLLHIASSGRSAAIGFRDGTPVTFDDPTPGHTLAAQFVERGQLTRAQCNAVLGSMTDALVDDETVAFFEHAVQLGYLTEDEANVELSMRIRTRMIQLFGWRDCEANLTPGSAALLDRRESPQNLGAILYMGVRTFYEEEFLRSCHPDLTQTYVRLSGSPATIAHFFGFDDEEFQLLRRIQPELPIAQLLADGRKVERVHLLGLLLLLRLAQFCEVAEQPHSRQFNPRQPTPRERRVQHNEPAPEDKSVARRAPTSPEAPRPSPPTLSTSSAPQALPDPPAPRPAAKSSVDATQEALLEAAARTARLRRSPLPPRRHSKHAEATPTRAAQGGSVAVKAPEPSGPPGATGAKPAQPEYAKAHLKELIARRKQAANAPEASAGRDAARELREARGLLQGQHYARAEKLLHSLLELEPQNEVYKTYYLWAHWRAQPEAAESSLGELRDLAKKLVAEAEHAGFAAYVLGHVFLHEKRDDLAEKFFKRAHAADRGNKDAERHLMILERRKQTAADGGSGANRKLFGIQLPNSKPKP